MNRCFLPQEPTRYDAALDVRTPTIDVTPAKQYGDVIVCLPQGVGLFTTHPVAIALEECMHDFDSDDYLIAAGDPTLIGMAFHIAVMKTGGRFNQLKWDRHKKEYLKLQVRVPV